MAIEEDFSEWEIASTGKMISYGLGYVFINYLLLFGLANLTYFYEVEMGLPAMYILIAGVVFAIWNMVNDPLLGFLTEKPTKWTPKYGLRAPWVVACTAPILIFFYLIWVPPQGATIMTLFIWFILMTCLHDTFFSIYNDHIYGGFTNQFPSEYERRRAFAIGTILMFILITIMVVIGTLVIQYGKPETFVYTAIIMIIFLVIFSIFIFPGIRESEEMKQMFLSSFDKAEKASFFSTMRTALKTKNFRVSLFGYTIQVTSYTLFISSLIYMFRYVYGVDYALSSIPAMLGMIAAILMIPFWYNYSRKHGFKKTYWVCYILQGVLYIPFLFTTDLLTHTIFFIIYQINAIGLNIMLMPVAADTYDEVSSNMGKRVDASLVGLRTFFFRVALLVLFIVLPVIHIVTGFNPNTETQTLEAQWGIRIAAALIPAILMITMGLIFRKYFTLEGEEKLALVKKLKDLGIYR